jgi:hypothetical protein
MHPIGRSEFDSHAVRLTLAVFVAACFGCEKTQSVGGRVVLHTSRSESSNEVRLVHDFGLVRPREKLNHTFAVRNTTRVPWNLDKITKTCSCAVARISTARIAPGETQEVDIAYRAAGKTSHDQRSIEITFKEDVAPVLTIQIRAHIQAPIAINVSDLVFTSLESGQIVSKTVEVQSDPNVCLSVKSDVDWITPEIELIPVRDSNGSNQTISKLCVTAISDSLSPGWHHAMVQVSGQDSEIEGAGLPVAVSVIRPISAVPGRLTFQSDSKPGSSNLLLRLSPSHSDVDVSSIGLHHDLGDALDLSLRRQSRSVLELRATWTPRARSETIRGLLKVTLPPDTKESLCIPVLVGTLLP